MAKPEIKAEAIRLRTEERLSMNEIRTRLSASKGILSVWLRPYPLTSEEYAKRKSLNKPKPQPKKARGEESEAYRIATDIQLSTARKGQIAEAAVLFRLVLRGLEPIRPIFEGDCVDWFVRAKQKILKLQVKFVSPGNKHGLPLVRITRSNCER
ncbi:MAG: hypothetical protein OK436_06555 [Thaumarchaeota archaeon]|nr:hypothetical protein [Nitrososphaerota archaeon]